MRRKLAMVEAEHDVARGRPEDARARLSSLRPVLQRAGMVLADLERRLFLLALDRAEGLSTVKVDANALTRDAEARGAGLIVKRVQALSQVLTSDVRTIPGAQLTRLLEAWQQGDSRAADELVTLVYAELRRMAKARLRDERPGHTLQATALVHEAWMRLMNQHGATWQNRAQFFAVAAQAMRRILVDHARKRSAAKRGDGTSSVDVDALAHVLTAPIPDDRLLALDAALEELATLDARQARIVELRFFGGLSVEEAADVLAVSRRPIKREWSTARAWLFRRFRRRSSESASRSLGLGPLGWALVTAQHGPLTVSFYAYTSRCAIPVFGGMYDQTLPVGRVLGCGRSWWFPGQSRRSRPVGTGSAAGRETGHGQAGADGKARREAHRQAGRPGEARAAPPRSSRRLRPRPRRPTSRSSRRLPRTRRCFRTPPTSRGRASASSSRGWCRSTSATCSASSC